MAGMHASIVSKCRPKWRRLSSQPIGLLPWNERTTTPRYEAAVAGRLSLSEITTMRRSGQAPPRSEEHTSELQSPCNLVCRLLLEKKKKNKADLTSSAE